MTVLKRRSRMVAFRMSEEDYQRLYSLCSSLGARSVSDLARTAINRLIGRDGSEGDPLVGKVEVLSQTVMQLQSTVEELSNRLSEAGRAAAEVQLPD